MSDLHNADNFCFCCLTENGVLNEFRFTTYECYTACSGYTPDLETQKKICLACDTKLKSSFEFRELCRTSYEKLKEKLECIPETLVKIKYEDLSGDPVFESLVHADSDIVNAVFIKSEHQIIAEETRANSRPVNAVFIKSEPHNNVEKSGKVKKAKKHVTEQTDYPLVPDDTAASDLEVEFLCLHCDQKILTHREYKKHSEQHTVGNTGRGYKKISKVCELCNQETSTFANHLLKQHRDYKPYRCKFCALQFRTSGTLRVHLNWHATAQNQFKCMACDEKFAVASKLRIHIQDHEKNNPKKVYFCPACGLTFDQFKPLHEHIEVNHDRTNAYPCFHCKKIFLIRKFCVDHECSGKTAKSEHGAFMCRRCGSSFVSADDLFCHEIIDCRAEFTCEVCEKSYPSKIKLQNHHRLVHLRRINRPLRICEICGHRSRDIGSHSLHMAGHQSERNFKCSRPGCNQTFKHKKPLTRHERVHELTDQMAYECHHCQKTFAVYTAIKAHMSVHYTEKSVKCKVCPQMFTTKIAAYKHYRTTHLVDHCLCKFCGVKVRQRSFREHLFKHRGFHPYTCTICPTNFTKHGSIRRHLKNKHGIENNVPKYVETEVDWVETIMKECRIKADKTLLIMPNPKKSRKREIETESDDD